MDIEESTGDKPVISLLSEFESALKYQLYVYNKNMAGNSGWQRKRSRPPPPPLLPLPSPSLSVSAHPFLVGKFRRAGVMEEGGGSCAPMTPIPQLTLLLAVTTLGATQ